MTSCFFITVVHPVRLQTEAALNSTVPGRRSVLHIIPLPSSHPPTLSFSLPLLYPNPFLGVWAGLLGLKLFSYA